MEIGKNTSPRRVSIFRFPVSSSHFPASLHPRAAFCFLPSAYKSYWGLMCSSRKLSGKNTKSIPITKIIAGINVSTRLRLS